MNLEKAVKKARKFSRPYVVDSGKKFRLKNCDPADTAGFGSVAKPAAREALEMGVETLAKLQDILYAQDRWSVLLIFQAMDAAGKDGAIKHVMSGVNPQGCQVASFKAPSSRSSTTTSSGAATSSFPKGAGSESSTVPITKTSSS